MVSITGIIWLTVTVLCWILAHKMFLGFKKDRTNEIFARFCLFFGTFSLFSLLASAPLLIRNPATLEQTFFISHIFLWISLIFLVDAAWLSAFRRYFPRILLPSLVIAGGALELYFQYTGSVNPEFVNLGFFNLIQWNLNATAFVLFLFTSWVGALPMGLVFIKKSRKLKGTSRARSFSFGLAFILIPLASLSLLSQPVEYILTEFLFVAAGIVACVFAAFIFTSATKKEEDEQ